MALKNYRDPKSRGAWAFGAGREFRGQVPRVVDEKTEAQTGVSGMV